MLFNSYEFLLLFLPLVLAGFFLLHQQSRRLALAWITASSLVFYGYWDYRYLALIIPSIVINCALGYLIARHWSRAWLIAGVAANLAVIGWFKYSLFLYLVVTNGATPPDFLKGIVLPLGISFFTFQQISYLVNVWRGHEQPARLETHAFIVLFFPHLIAGPIVLYENIAWQVRRRPRLAGYLTASFKIGLLIFAIGLFKKVVIADSLAPFANAVFTYAVRSDTVISAKDAWLGAAAYSLQLYFDFSGYSDMAIGLGRMFGFRLPVNFNSPYKAANIIEFWHRWHITLSSFFRNYVYIPLGGNRRGRRQQLAFILIVFFLTGLWHGAAWAFIAWGVTHGVLVVINHAWSRAMPGRLRSLLAGSPMARKAYNCVAWGLTATCVTLLWVPFRAESLPVALKMIGAMLNPFVRTYSRVFPDINLYLVLWISLVGLHLWCWCAPNTQTFVRYVRRLRRGGGAVIMGGHKSDVAAGWVYTCVVGVALYLSFASIGYVKSEFIYFNF
ncbi:MAG: MBOAT family protein [Burkholderiales bacterium]|nr:Peptidoglycan O-acetyltransferase [Rhodocyclaceae bacterium]MCZ2175322.1 MBOAT family protein [Burkholderiales bacterium]MCZ2420984.1 MBOAT family protein [Burkholderiales bacterium]